MVAPVVFSSGFNMEGFMRWTSTLLHEMHKPSTVSTGREMWANSMHDKLWVWWTSTVSQNLLPKQTRSLLFATTSWSRKVKTCEGLETSAKLWVLVSNISSPRLKRRYTRFFFFVYFAAFRTARSHSFFCAVHVGVLCSTRWRTACGQRNSVEGDFNKEPWKEPLV